MGSLLLSSSPLCIYFNQGYCYVGKDKSVVLWSIHDHVSALAGASSDKSPGASPDSLSNKRSVEAGDEKNSKSPTVGPRGVFQGHEDTVEDVQFCPAR